MNSVTLILSVSVIILLLYVIFSLLRRNTYTGSIGDASVSREVTVAQNTSPAAAYSIWIYISEWKSGVKNIFDRNNISIGLDDSINYLTVTVPEITSTQYKKYPSYYFKVDTGSTGSTGSTGATYYYGTNENCEMLCNKDTCGGFNYYKKPPASVPTSDMYRLSNIMTNGCILINSDKSQPYNLINNTTDDYDIYAEIKNSNKKTYIVETYIPIQEWVFITINMDSQYTEVYINGKMVRTIINTNAKNTDTTVTLSKGSGFVGSKPRHSP